MNTYTVVNRNGDAIFHSTAIRESEHFALTMSQGVSRPYTVIRADGTVVSVWFNGHRAEDTEGDE